MPLNGGAPETLLSLPFDEVGSIGMFPDGRRFVERGLLVAIRCMGRGPFRRVSRYPAATCPIDVPTPGPRTDGVSLTGSDGRSSAKVEVQLHRGANNLRCRSYYSVAMQYGRSSMRWAILGEHRAQHVRVRKLAGVAFSKLLAGSESWQVDSEP